MWFIFLVLCWYMINSAHIEYSSSLLFCVILMVEFVCPVHPDHAASHKLLLLSSLFLLLLLLLLLLRVCRQQKWCRGANAESRTLRAVWLKATPLGTDSSWSLRLTVSPAGQQVWAKSDHSHTRSGHSLFASFVSFLVYRRHVEQVKCWLMMVSATAWTMKSMPFMT